MGFSICCFGNGGRGAKYCKKKIKESLRFPLLYFYVFCIPEKYKSSLAL
jgi:hypothetical protein